MTSRWRSTLHRQKRKKTICDEIGHSWKATMIPTVRICAQERCRAASHLVGGVWTTIEQTSTQNAQVTSAPLPVEQLGVSWSSGTLRPASAPSDVADLRAGYALPTKEKERQLEQEYYHLSRYY